MANKCTVCAHSRTEEIERLIVAGKPNTHIADKFGLDHQSVRYHKLHHLPEKLVRHVSKKEREHTQDLFSNIQAALDEANDILQEARDKKQNRLSLDAIKTILSANELFAKMIAKTKEFENADQQRKDDKVEQYIQKGLQALSDDELRAFIQLMGKIHSQQDDYELDDKARYVVDAMNSIQMDGANNNTNNKQSDSQRNGSGQYKNTQNVGQTEADEPFSNDLDLDLDFDDNLDLSLDRPSNQIPDENSDPEWLRKWRKKNPPRYHRP